MTTAKSVLGVLGMCWVGFGYPTQVKASNGAALRAVCWVCWVCARVRACVLFIAVVLSGLVFSYARAEKPNKPNTLNTNNVKALFLKGFSCVGFVLGWPFLCRVGGVA
jgi:hypothetical protein